MDGTGEHDGAFVAVFFQGVEQGGGEAEIALHELFLVLRTVHAGEVEDEVALATIGLKFFLRTPKVVLEDVFDVV